MNSSDISLNPLGDWVELSPRYRAPRYSGVYVVRTTGANPIGRLKGVSDLIYVGQGRLTARLRAHVSGRPLRDKGWLLDLIAKQVSGLEVRCFQSDKPKDDEDALLIKYFEDHLELPPANLSASKTVKGYLLVRYLDPDVRGQVIASMSSQTPQ